MRIVTANDASGRSVILTRDDPGPHGLIWQTSDEEPFGCQPVPGDHDLIFPAGQTLVRYIEIPTDTAMAGYLAQGIPGHDAQGFHRTATLDFIVLLEGKLTLELDEGSVDVKPGDVVVQRDTRHAWRNPGVLPAKCLAVMLSPRISA